MEPSGDVIGLAARLDLASQAEERLLREILRDRGVAGGDREVPASPPRCSVKAVSTNWPAYACIGTIPPLPAGRSAGVKRPSP